jgi:O-methyltransferase involved in polyketide biosynthesis
VARTNNDSWEITESVGATALGVAAARAAETQSENPLIKDPFAQVFLDAVGDGVWNWHSAPELPPELIEAEPQLPLQMRAMVSYMASRTAFFDQFFLDATHAGIRQVVILAAGLDSRAWRLAWRRRWPRRAPNRRATGSPCRWICVRIGRTCCGRPGSTRQCPVPGRPRG